VRWIEQKAPELVSRVNAPVSSREGLDGEVRVESKVDGKIRKGRVFFALRAPDSLLLEVVSPSDDTLATLVMDGEKFVVFERGDPECRVGAPCAANVASVLPIYLDAPDVLRLLYGHPPLLDGAVGEPEKDTETGRWVLTVKGADGRTQRVEFSSDGRDVLKAVIQYEDKVLLDVRYSNYGEGPHGGRLPFKTEIRNPTAKARVKLRVLDVQKLNEREGTFATGCPPGTRPVQVECP
jgi:hypothetical protein